MAEDMNMEVFIEQVKFQPVIWNTADENYRDRTRTREAWMSISRFFVERFEERGDREKNEICNRMIKKWRNIKDNYVKSLKKKRISGHGPETGKQYIYARILSSFLEASELKSESRSSFDGDDEEYDQDNQHESEQQAFDRKPQLYGGGNDLEQNGYHPHQTLLSQQQLNGGSSNVYDHRTLSRKRRRDMEPPLMDFMQAPFPMVDTVTPDSGTTEADRAFFESILPSIRDFNEDQKLELRCEILNLIRRMRTAARAATSSTT